MKTVKIVNINRNSVQNLIFKFKMDGYRYDQDTRLVMPVYRDQTAKIDSEILTATLKTENRWCQLCLLQPGQEIPVTETGQGTGRKRMATSSTGAPYHANLATTAAGGDVVLRKLLS
jgi:hypothetical protein